MYSARCSRRKERAQVDVGRVRVPTMPAPTLRCTTTLAVLVLFPSFQALWKRGHVLYKERCI